MNALKILNPGLPQGQPWAIEGFPFGEEEKLFQTAIPGMCEELSGGRIPFQNPNPKNQTKAES